MSSIGSTSLAVLYAMLREGRVMRHKESETPPTIPTIFQNQDWLGLAVPPPMQQPPQYPNEVQPPPPNSTEYPAVHQTLVDSAVHQSLVVESSGGQQIEISNE